MKIEEKIKNQLKIKKIQEMKNPTILMNENDFDIFKKEIESKVYNINIGNDPKYEGIPIKINNIAESGNVILYDDISLNSIFMNGLFENIKNDNIKVVFGLGAQGHIPTIQAEIERRNKLYIEHFPNDEPLDMSYSKHVWEGIGKIIGWCPFTAALYYFKWLHDSNNIKK